MTLRITFLVVIVLVACGCAGSKRYRPVKLHDRPGIDEINRLVQGRGNAPEHQ